MFRCAARIETLHVKFWVYPHHTLSLRTVQALLNSGLEFPALKALRLEGPEYGPAPSVLLTAPRLRTLDIERFDSANCTALLSPGLEIIRLYHNQSTSPQTLDILDRCSRAWRVVLDYGRHRTYDSHYPSRFFEAFTRRRPLVSALRELELATPDADLGHILKAGFSDAVLRTITGRLYNPDMDLLTHALLPGLGSPVVFGLAPGMQQLELHDNDGHIWRLQCWDEDSLFEIDWVWEYLCDHYQLHETVQEIRISHWMVSTPGISMQKASSGTLLRSNQS
ncbi:hypothetical protein C8R45DRAFT_809310 [Mycena sanguinolenta]|nr:hypothetical protein C8R45DRAFT_809310 [Mycena sanguinolenta]